MTGFNSRIGRYHHVDLIRRWSSTRRSSRFTPTGPSSRWIRITAATSGQTAISALTGRSSGPPSRNPRRSTTGPISQNGSERPKTSRQNR
jgi:hypothetical protein